MTINDIKKHLLSPELLLPSFFLTLLVIVILDYNKKIQISELQKSVDMSFAKNVDILERQMEVVKAQNQRSTQEYELLLEYKRINEQNIESIKSQNIRSIEDRRHINERLAFFEERQKSLEERVKVIEKLLSQEAKK